MPGIARASLACLIVCASLLVWAEGGGGWFQNTPDSAIGRRRKCLGNNYSRAYSMARAFPVA